MPFKHLMEPECGGSNPLVKVAGQLAQTNPMISVSNAWSSSRKATINGILISFPSI